MKTLNIKVGQNHTRQKLITDLLKLSYEKTSILDKSGSFCIEGGNISIYPIDFDSPVRIEQFGNEVENIYQYDLDGIIFSDEAKISLFGFSTGERYKKGNQPTQHTVKHPQKLNVWWGISNKYKIKPYIFKENMDGDLYRKIISERLPTSDNEGWILQQDNDPKHKAIKTMKWIDEGLAGTITRP